LADHHVAVMLVDVSYVTVISLVLSFLLRRPPPTSTLFPYTTLFRSLRGHGASSGFPGRVGGLDDWVDDVSALVDMARGRPPAPRSEEHTSELQSQSNLVCRLLLEKKKKHR